MPPAKVTAVESQPFPTQGSVVRVRQRTWLVTHADNPNPGFQSGVVDLACLDDDAAGDTLQVMWSHEIDAACVSEQSEALGGARPLDPPRLFGAYLHAMRWNTVTSTDHRLLQAPFRAGIDLKAYQLEPLRKALELPRVNLFIADDVGLGKTIEAGLVVQELVLRQRIDQIIVICPPTVTVQWQDELAQRFGLHFERYNREFVTARRRERGFGVNPWTTHNRFIVSFALLRGTRSTSGHGSQHLELLVQHLGDKAARTLLIVDECHQVAPSGSSAYPIDSRTTRAIRQIAERVGHRLFLSATPHNGHSYSFASLLHLLDPQRFTRGVPIQSAEELSPIMVRRLKRHLRDHVSGLPRRELVDHEVRFGADSAEVRLGTLLDEYDGLYRACLSHLPERQANARSLVIINLHKRLLSSIWAFHHTLRQHAAGARVALRDAPKLQAPPRRADDTELSEDALDTAEDNFVLEASFDAGARAQTILSEMLSIAERARAAADARVHKLAAWINREMCPTGTFNQRRLVIFTEYEHTLSWLRRVLPPLLLAQDESAMQPFTGRLDDAHREKLKAAFNSPPESSRLRILLATDAAREGINLQAHCADLFHFDLPWNPSRVEQRNGRIDRVLQPEPVVRCHYFDCVDRPEDRVLVYLIKKLHRIRDELGSLSAVVSDRLAARMEVGLRGLRTGDIDRLSDPGDLARKAQEELEGTGAALLKGDLDALDRQRERSERQLNYRPEHLQELVDLGLEMVAGSGLRNPSDSNPQTFDLPPLDASWDAILDLMRSTEPSTERNAKPPVRPVAFRAAHRLDAPAVQLHLGHPLVKRLVARFRAQGVARHDLSRVTLIENTRDSSRRVVVFARLSLYGEGATRLHEEIITFAAQIRNSALEPFAVGGAGEATTLERLGEALAHRPEPHPSAEIRHRVRHRAGDDFRALWPSLRDQATAAAASARTKLLDRGTRESIAMEALLTAQRAKILEQFDEDKQSRFGFMDESARDQFNRDRRFMEKRLETIEVERNTEPAAILQSYAVVLERFEPIGMAYLWPAS